MSEVTEILERIEHGDSTAAERLLPLVYDELRRLAAQKLAQEQPGHTLQPTALVHEAYLRLVGSSGFENHGHFFAAAAEAMRRILIENARRKTADKRGGRRTRLPIDHIDSVALAPPEELLALDEALEELARHDAVAAELVKVRYYAGLSVEQAAAALEISTATAYRHWTFGRAWLHAQLLEDDSDGPFRREH